jgi:hypothetical protein
MADQPTCVRGLVAREDLHELKRHLRTRARQLDERGDEGTCQVL